MKKKKKSTADVGVVLHRITSLESLKQWAEYMATIDPWKSLELSGDSMFNRWQASEPHWSFFSAANPRGAKSPGFENDKGLIVIAMNGTRSMIEGFLKASLPPGLEDGGYIQTVATKVRQKGIGKYLLNAAERLISERYARVYLFVSESNSSAQRFYKGAGYEEIARVSDCIKPGNTELLLTKRLTS